jgi:hypothetical protein
MVGRWTLFQRPTRPRRVFISSAIAQGTVGMRVVRYGLGVVIVASLLTSAAFAANLTVSSKKLGAGSTVVAPCDTNNANWTYGSYTTNSNGQVTGLSVGNIARACIGGSLSVTTTDGTGGHQSTSSGVSIPSGAGSCTSRCTQPVTLATPEYPADIAKVYVVVTGP